MAPPTRVPSDIYGIWCRRDSKFYYFDSGIHTTNLSTQRVLRTLTARGLIEIDPQNQTRAGLEPYKIMTLSEAEEKKYEIVRLTINEPTKSRAPKGIKKLDAWK